MDVPDERPAWARKPLADLTAGEITDALGYLENSAPGDDVLCRVLADELAVRISSEPQVTVPDSRKAGSRIWTALPVAGAGKIPRAAAGVSSPARRRVLVGHPGNRLGAGSVPLGRSRHPHQSH